MQNDQAAVLVRNLLDVFNERDESRRLAVIQEIYTDQACFFEAEQSFLGFQSINRRVTEVLATIPPEATFRTAGDSPRNHNLAHLPWTLELDNGAVLAKGMDVAILDANRISALYLFIDPSPTGN